MAIFSIFFLLLYTHPYMAKGGVVRSPKKPSSSTPEHSQGLLKKGRMRNRPVPQVPLSFRYLSKSFFFFFRFFLGFFSVLLCHCCSSRKFYFFFHLRMSLGAAFLFDRLKTSFLQTCCSRQA